MHYLMLDTETTGLSTDKHDIIQLACIPIINGKRLNSFNEFAQPSNYANVDPAATAIHGITVERMKTFQSSKIMIEKFIQYLRSFNVKFVISGFNVGFDKRFISSWFLKHGKENEFFQLFELHIHDTYVRAQVVKAKLGTENLKLETLAKHINVTINAHDALSDISATIEVDKHIAHLLGEDSIEDNESLLPLSSNNVITHSKFPEPAQLHLHSVYGMVDSIPEIEEWTKWCEDNNVPGFSIVDHGSAVSLFGMTRIKSTKVTGVPGVGLNLKLPEYGDDIFTVNAWAISNTGYFNLMKLASVCFDDVIEIDNVNYPRVTEEQIRQYSEGILFGTSDVYGAIAKQIEAGSEEGAEKIFLEYLRIFGDKLYVEFNPCVITHKFMPKTGFQRIKKNALIVDGDLNKAYNLFLSRMIDKNNIPNAIPSCGANFIDPNDKLLQDCVAKNSYKSGKCFNESHHAKKADEMFVGLKQHLGDWLTEEKFLSWINKTLEIVELAKSIVVKHDYHLPKIEIPEHIKQETDDYNRQLVIYTIQKCQEHGRWNDSVEYVERFKKEMDVIAKNKVMNFLPYFLMYEDIGAYARSQGILQNVARGSAGGSLLSYYLKIIHIDPIKNDLPFERFLSHSRILSSRPDIDSDFGQRNQILAYLEQKYKVGFAQLCTLQKMKTKVAIKSAMWALYGVNGEDINVKRICELIPDSLQGIDEIDFLYGFTDDEGLYHDGVVDTVSEVKAFFKQFPAVENMVKRLIGLVRGWGRHASAFVISSLDLASTRTPTMKMLDKKMGEDVLVTQFDAPMIEKVGLVKADILGVSTINAVSDCIDLIRERTGIDYLEEDDKGVALVFRLPEDKRVYADFYNKKTDSSFQFNTDTVKAFIQDFAPTSRDQLAVLTALLRPGAMDAPFINDEIKLEDGVTAAQYYIDVRKGTRKLSYLHPDLAPYTSLAVFSFQEQIMKFLVEFAGYSLEESDQIRAAISKKKLDVIQASFARIREAALKRGWSEEQISAVCSQIEAFSKYSFNKSHSYAYAELGYITMYLKNHHPLEWWTAILNNTKKEEKVRHYIAQLGNMITAPSLMTPTDHFKIVGDNIVAPLSVLKSVGPAAITELIAKGPFSSLEDYVSRVQHNKINKGHFGAIVQGRAADCFIDKNVPYSQGRIDLLNKYVALRKCTKFSDKLYSPDPIDIFMLERETNKTFNKSLLEDPVICGMLETLRPDFIYAGKKNVPFVLEEDNNNLFIISGVKVANRLIEQEDANTIGMICFFESSSHMSGISKKSGKPYNMVKVTMNDGQSQIDGVIWKQTKALNLPKNSIILVQGTLNKGWGGIPNITIKKLETIR